MNGKDVIELEVKKKDEEKEEYLETTETLSGSPFWEDWVEESKKIVINKAIAREVARRKTAMKIIKLLYNHKEPLMQKEIYKLLNVSQELVFYALKKLLKCNIVEIVTTTPINLHTRYYQLPDLTLAERLIRRYHYLVSFKLAKLVPFKGISFSKLKTNAEFVVLTIEYGLTVDEALEVLQMNKRKLTVTPVKNYQGYTVDYEITRKEQ